LRRHHLLHLTHETLTLIFLFSYHHHGSRRPPFTDLAVSCAATSIINHHCTCSSITGHRNTTVLAPAPFMQRTSDTTTQTPETRARTTTMNLHQFASTIADARQLHLLFHEPDPHTPSRVLHAPADSSEREPYLEIANQRRITTNPPLQQRMHHLRQKTPPHHHAGVATTSKQPRRHAQPREGEECESETLILERDSLHHVSSCYWTVKLVNWSKSAVNSGQNCKNG